MGVRSRMRSDQIRGVNFDTLFEEVNYITEQQLSYDKPVRTVSELPLLNNQFGDTRMVIDEATFYVWDDVKRVWITKRDKSTEKRTTTISVEIEKQLIFNTNINVGSIGGISSLLTVEFKVNGVGQMINHDYIVGMDANKNLVCEWKATDFDLEIGDFIILEYDILIS